jgi:RNA polymerase sigma-70 factor, ECF subfamily
MDITDEAKLPFEGDLECGEGAVSEFVPEEHAERILSLFRDTDTLDKEEDRRLLGGDSDQQILALYVEYRPRLISYIRRLRLTWEEAEEVVQETFVALMSALLAEGDIENVQGWIVRVSHHLAVSVLRRKGRDEARIREVPEFVWESFVDPTTGPEESHLKKEQRRQMEKALTEFTAQQQQCFQMRREGFRYKDIGFALGISTQRAALITKQIMVRLAVICG